MLRRGLLAISILIAAEASAWALPPSQEEMNAQIAFFKVLPNEFPTRDVAPLKAVVADNVQVFDGSKLRFSTSESWIADLQGLAPSGPGFPSAYTVSRDKYARLADGGVMVHEFSYPVAPEGAQIVYHVSFTSRLATYYIEGGKLVRVVYGPWMESYGGLCQAVEQAKGNMQAWDQIYKFCL